MGGRLPGLLRPRPCLYLPPGQGAVVASVRDFGKRRVLTDSQPSALLQTPRTGAYFPVMTNAFGGVRRSGRGRFPKAAGGPVLPPDRDRPSPASEARCDARGACVRR